MADLWQAPKRINRFGCWLWLLGGDTQGYGQIWFKSKCWRVHRLAYVLTYGALTPGVVVRHLCDHKEYRRCFNPAHLVSGSNNDNQADRALDGLTVDERKDFLVGRGLPARYQYLETLNPSLSPGNVRRFWAHVDKSGDCWLWRGEHVKGRGRFYILKASFAAHRIAWQLAHGALSFNRKLVNTCGHLSCVLPSHHHLRA